MNTLGHAIGHTVKHSFFYRHMNGIVNKTQYSLVECILLLLAQLLRLSIYFVLFYCPDERIAYVNFLYNFYFLPYESVQRLNREHLFLFCRSILCLYVALRSFLSHFT